MRHRILSSTFATATLATFAALSVAAAASAAPQPILPSTTASGTKAPSTKPVAPQAKICTISDNSAHVVARQGMAGRTTLRIVESLPLGLLPRSGRYDVRVEWHNLTTDKRGASFRSVPVSNAAPEASFIDLPTGRGTTVYRIAATEWTFATFSGTCVGRFRVR